jgi:putative membrane protein
MKKAFRFSYLASAALFLFACNDNAASYNKDTGNTSTDSTSNRRGDLGKPRDTSVQEDNIVRIDSTPVPNEVVTNFLTEAAGGGMMEVTLGQVAQQNAQDPRVKAFGAMMVADHTKANNDLKAIATPKHFALPAALPEKHQHHVEKLSKKQGRDFDKAYMSMMLDDHQQDIKAFSKAAENGSDTTVQSFAKRTLPVLIKHLDSARAINRAL